MIIQRVKNWIRVSRANFIPVSILPYSVGALFAARDCPFHLLKFLLGLFGGSLVLIAACLLNEYWDYRFRADLLEDGCHPYFGGSKVIQEGLLSPAAVRRGAWFCFSIAFLLGGGRIHLPRELSAGRSGFGRRLHRLGLHSSSSPPYLPGVGGGGPLRGLRPPAGQRGLSPPVGNRHLAGCSSLIIPGADDRRRSGSQRVRRLEGGHPGREKESPGQDRSPADTHRFTGWPVDGLRHPRGGVSGRNLPAPISAGAAELAAGPAGR